MTDNEYNFILEDRIAKIQSINQLYDLENNSYISYSGGKDSTILHYLIDLALPDNHIPRVYANTGIEYMLMVKYVKDLARNDDRIVILNQTRNIRRTLEQYGYPFKSKEHSQRVMEFNRNSQATFLRRYLDYNDIKCFKCPKKLLYQFEEIGKYNYSNQCCFKLKKELVHQWQKISKKKITITGMRSDEGGTRKGLTCLTKNNTMFHPLIVVSSEWEEEFIKRNNIELCKLYYPPYNFKRTGCKGCPFNMKIQEDLNTLYKLLPSEYYQCLHLWKYVYDEYVRIGYRLKYYPHEKEVKEND